MNGLQFVPISVSKRVRCLPICPLGTCGRVLSRRLARTVQTQSPKNISSRPPLDPAVTKLTPLSTHLRPDDIKSLLRAISSRDDVEIWRAFIKMCRQGQTDQLTPADFSAILLSLRPKRYLSLRARHYCDSRGRARLVNATLHFEEFQRRLKIVTLEMQKHGHRIGVMEFAHLLDCARAGKNKEMAEKVWNQMAGEDGLIPDTWCYNSYIAAVCGTVSMDREMLVTEYRLGLRSQESNEDVYARAVRLYRNMVHRGLVPNSMTFDILILAMARMGDVDSIKKTLRRVWGVDVDDLENPDENLVSSNNEPVMEPSNSLYPKIHTLTSIAVAFGSNSSVSTAIRIVDHMARRYSIEIPTAAWVALLNWTYVVTTPDIKTMPGNSVLDLWNIMISPPYSIKPTIEMYDYIVRSLLHRQMPDKAEEFMFQALELYKDIIRRITGTERRLRSLSENSSGISYYYQGEEDDVNVENIEKDLIVVKRDEFRGRSYIRRWVELLVLGKGMEPWHPEFARIRVPSIIRRWDWALGKQVVYLTDSGNVELTLKHWGLRTMPIRKRKRPWTRLGSGGKEEDYLF